MTKEAASRLIANYAIVKYAGLWEDIKRQLELGRAGVAEGLQPREFAKLGPRPDSTAYMVGRAVGRHPILAAGGLVGGGALAHKLLSRKRVSKKDEEQE